MASITQNLRKINQFILNKNCFQLPVNVKGYAQKKKIVVKKIDSVGTSLAAKGFLRPTKAYTPPKDAASTVKTICSNLKLSSANDYILSSTEQKFKILSACFEAFKHSVPNSQVYEIKTIGDVVEFYQTAVDTTVPFEALKQQELPENLHIQYDYLRFNPDSDTKFNGKTAFPKSSTLVTGLKYREKYAGHIAKRSWP